MTFYGWGSNLIAMLGVLVLWGLGAWFHTNWPAGIGAVGILVWDIGFYLNKDAWNGRDYENILSQTNTARSQISYFLPFYGVLFGILFTLSDEERGQIQGLMEGAGIPVWLLVLPLVLASVGLMFFPIQVKKDKAAWKGDGEEEGRTPSMKMLLVLTVLFQKLSIFLLVHVILRIAMGLWGS